MKKRKWRSITDAGLYDPDAYKRPAKVRITTFVDHDMLAKLKTMAANENRPYQGLLNDCLRKAVALPKEKK